jgi:hypothetical protein
VSDRPVHDRLEELYAAEALSGLDDDGRHELREILTWHDPRCAECARLRADYADVAATLALSLEPVQTAPGAEERLLTATRTVEQRQGVTARGVLPPSVARLDDVREEREEKRRRPMRVVAAAMAAAACLLGAAILGYSVRGTTSSPDQIVAAYTAQPGTRSATMAHGDQQVVVYYRPGQQTALVVGHGLDDPPAGHVYELWYLPEGQTDMAPGGIFTPEDGTAVAPATIAAPFTTLAVSIEPGYMTAPTGTVVLSTPSGS